MKKTLVGIIGMLLISMMALTGCSNTTATKISVVGSTTIAPAMEEVAVKYNNKNPNIKVEVQGVGSSAGIKAASEGSAQIGMSSRELKEKEKKLGLKETIIAHDGIAVITHPSNPVKNLTQAQIKGIFEGTIKNWKEVGGNDKDIILVSREAGAGTREAFEDIIGLYKKKGDKKATTIAPSSLISEGNGSIKATVSSKKASIGFVSIGYLDDTVKAVQVDGIDATEETVKEGKYVIARPLLIISKPDAGKDVQDFENYIMGDEGQEIMGKKYVPVK